MSMTKKFSLILILKNLIWDIILIKRSRFNARSSSYDANRLYVKESFI